jgi:hypothetical protein
MHDKALLASMPARTLPKLFLTRPLVVYGASYQKGNLNKGT